MRPFVKILILHSFENFSTILNFGPNNIVGLCEARHFEFGLQVDIWVTFNVLYLLQAFLYSCSAADKIWTDVACYLVHLQCWVSCCVWLLL